MRTTIEIDNNHRADLLRLAAQRGEKGFSAIVREALDLYMTRHRAKQEAVERALTLKGSFSGKDAEALQASLRSLREKWR